MTTRKFYTFRVNDATPDDHIGRLGEITYRDGYLYYHDGATAGGELINGGGSGGGGPTSWASVTGKPSFATVATSGSYADLTGKPSIPSVGDFIFSSGDASLPAGNPLTLSTFRSGANEESRLTLSPTTESSLYAAGVLKLGTGYGSGSEKYWQFGTDGSIRFPDASTQTTAYTGSYNDLTNKPSLFSGAYADLTGKPSIPSLDGYATEAWVTSQGYGSGDGGGATALSGLTDVVLEGPIEGSVLTWNDSQQKWENRSIPVATEISNSDGFNTYSVSVGTDGVVTMNTARGGIEFGALPEVGGTSHLHIMRPAGQNSSTDLYFGDDYNYVKLPSASGAGTQGVEIGSSYGQGAVSTWRFGTDGALTLPAGGDIKDSTGTSVLGGGSANTGNITFSGDNISGSDNVVRIRSLDTTTTASYNFTPGNGDYSTAVWNADAITFNDPTQAIYDAIWALTNLSAIQVQVGSTWFTVTSTGSSTPGMPQAPTLFINQTAVGGPLNIDVVDIEIIQGTESYAEIDGSDFRVDVQDDIRMYANDTFLLSNRSTSDPIRIETNDGSHQWSFNSDGDLILPDGGDIKDDNGNSLLFSGSYNDLSDTPSFFGGDYNDLTNKPTSRIAVATGSGPGGNLQADSLALAGLNPVTDIPSTWGGDLILQGGVGGANGDLYGEVRIKSGQIGANYEWHFTTDKKIKLPAGGSIVDSTGANVFVSLATLKQVVADSTDFADFKSRIAGM